MFIVQIATIDKQKPAERIFPPHLLTFIKTMPLLLFIRIPREFTTSLRKNELMKVL